MTDLDTALGGARDAMTDLIGASAGCTDTWTRPRAPGKWSPSQTVEHVARALEESANVVSGAPSKFPTLPVFLRPVVRAVFFNRILKRGTFPKARTSKPFDPTGGPASPADGGRRLQAAMAKFDQACRARARSGQPVNSTIFGRVSVEDYARFQELHIRHHRKQMPGA